MFDQARARYEEELARIREAGLWKEERTIVSDQKARIGVEWPEGSPRREVLNFCANNYLGLANHPRLVAAAKEALDSHGFGMASVRFICGTQDLHQRLEGRIATFFGTDDAILYSSCFDANGGLFETLLGPEDAIVTDALNHASIIDGIRLCKAKRYIYDHGDMASLDKALTAARTAEPAPARDVLIATDGVFSMDGDVAKLPEICDLAEKHRAMVMVDDSHATGFIGENGRGTPELCGVMGRIDVMTSTLGKAMGGASGGFTTGRREIVALLRQRSRPYLFSNSLAPSIAAAALAAFDLLAESGDLRGRLRENTARFRGEMTRLGFDLVPGDHPIVPVLFGRFPDDAKLAQGFARDLFQEGIYAVGFFFPVVPKGKARIRVQLSAAHSPEDVNRALAAFEKIGRARGVI